MSDLSKHRPRVFVHVPDGTGFEKRDALSLLATLVAGEALSEPYVGKLAVAWVVRNRVENPNNAWFGAGWHGVMLKKWQFSCFNANDPVCPKLVNVTKWAGVRNWYECYKAAAAAFFDFENDPTSGADHYHTTSVAPYWAADEKPVVQIGAHLFYRLSEDY